MSAVSSPCTWVIECGIYASGAPHPRACTSAGGLDVPVELTQVAYVDVEYTPSEHAANLISHDDILHACDSNPVFPGRLWLAIINRYRMLSLACVLAAQSDAQSRPSTHGDTSDVNIFHGATDVASGSSGVHRVTC